jgi:Flp pilus assembly pilin Flp
VNVVSYCHSWVAVRLRSRWGQREDGAALVEYALLVAFIAILCVAAVAFLGYSVANKFGSVGSGVGN